MLGELTVDGAGADLGRLDRKARSLLQLLALGRGRPVPADALVDALWGDRPPAKPADQLAVLASRLRRELGKDRVERVDGGYRLRADRIDLDDLGEVVAEAERRAARGEVAGAVAAARVGLALVRGPVPEVAYDDGWAGAERAAAVRLVQRARRVAASALLAAGHWADALEIATADSLADPLDEEAMRLVMRAQAAAGRPALALASYASLRATLADQLGADPAPETEALHTAILRGEVAAAPLRVGPVLVGRATQLHHLDHLVARAAADRAPRVARVSGAAGMGKTTLLTSWAAARRELGDVVLTGTCGPLDRAAPLDVVLTALADRLAAVPDAQDLLGAEAAVLGPLLGLGDRAAPAAPDPSLGPTTLYAAVTAVLGRIAGTGHAVLVIDDAHLAGPPLADWVAYLRRRSLPLVVVLGARPSERTDAPVLPTTDEVALGPLDRGQVAEVVGEERADDLYRRTGGHPLFLAELAAAPTGELPPTLVAAVTARCDQLGAAGEVVRTAAVLGALDVDLLADVLGRSPLDVLGDAELACDQGLLVDDAGRLRFRHELVREALVSGTTERRAAVLHREAGRALARRPDADPLAIAEHARRGDDRPLAASALRTAAARAAERFDHATAEAQLDRSLDLVPDDATRVQRARVRIQRAHYAEAEADAVAATDAGAERWETAAWAAYYDRRFDDALRYADDGAVAADAPATLARCLVASGRILHAGGDLSLAEERLTRAMDAASGGDRIEAAAWLGVVHAHRGRPAQAVELLRPVTRAGVGAAHTSAFLHALLFIGHAHAVDGQGAAALECFARYDEEVQRRDVPRFAGRGVNFAGWVLRNLGAVDAGLDRHHRALDEIARDAIPEVEVAALEDLADERVRAGDGAGAARHLERARSCLHGDLVFGWRLAMRLDLLDAQVRLLGGDGEGALRVAEGLRAAAVRAGVPRYDACARLVAHRALAALGEPVDPDEAWRDLQAVERVARVEAWWWAGETGAALGRVEWLERAEQLAAELAATAGPHADDVRAEADRRLARWRDQGRAVSAR